MNYLFYDLETSGLCESFDQIFRFACIITDENLNEVNRHEISIKLRADVIPSPRALAITRLSLDDISDGICEYEALIQIHNLFNKPNQINIGYNSIRFDNTMLRLGFYRNLLDPYTHQYKNNSYRADVMNINLIYYLYKHDVLKWSNDRPLKLENINNKNNLFDGKSHDAMVDVEVTTELARRLRDYDSRIWEYLINGFIKNNDKSRLNNLPRLTINDQDYIPGVYSDISLGYASNCCCAALFIGQHKYYKNQSLWMKIDYPDISQLFNGSDSSPRIIRRKDGEPGFVMPWNQSYYHVIGEDRIENTKNNMIWLSENQESLEKFINKQIDSKYDEQDSTDLDGSIYSGGLFSDHEILLMNSFHNKTGDERKDFLLNLEESRIKKLGLRILFRNFPELLDSTTNKDIITQITQLEAVSIKGTPRRTPKEAINKINEILIDNDYDEEQIKILHNYLSHLNTQEN